MRFASALILSALLAGAIPLFATHVMALPLPGWLVAVWTLLNFCGLLNGFRHTWFREPER